MTAYVAGAPPAATELRRYADKKHDSEGNEILPGNSGQTGSSDNQGRMDSACSPVP
ncbi:hypothetical protein [Nitrosococcus oceani]|uniref:hypothetical protein n=1 Tax=Nitrosococcus oceani TaxID=1229 RepID=UPI0012DE4EC6|nr:hypothetical protein [Nitrosococcus oceani]